MAAILIGASLVSGWSLGGPGKPLVSEWRNADAPPFNATARCRDDTWSWSKQPDSPNACPNHGGVAEITAAGQAKIIEDMAKKRADAGSASR
jgi:hypothetical protein